MFKFTAGFIIIQKSRKMSLLLRTKYAPGEYYKFKILEEACGPAPPDRKPVTLDLVCPCLYSLKLFRHPIERPCGSGTNRLQNLILWRWKRKQGGHDVLPTGAFRLTGHATWRTMIVRLISTAQTGFCYTTQRLRQGPKLSAVKYDPKGAVLS